jgi:hypothetical protein
MLPNAMLIGAQKCGTKSVYRMLSDHPQIGLSRIKEPHFFDRDENYLKGWEWYEGLFEESAGKICFIEATPHYYRSRFAAERIVKKLPDIKLMLILRDPADRAYSNYWFNVGRGAEQQPFEEIIRTEQGRERYITKGFYMDHIEMYLSMFDRDQLKVCLLDDIRKDSKQFMREVFAFLQLETELKIEKRHSNLTAIPSNQFSRFCINFYSNVSQLIPQRVRNSLVPLKKLYRNRFMQHGYPPISRETRSFLVDMFRDRNIALGEFLGRDLTAWNE